METIYFLEGRGQIYPYHFYVLVLGGLYYIFNEIEHNGPLGTSVKFSDPNKITNIRPELNFPIKINIGNPGIHDLKDYHLSALEIIKDKVEFVDVSKLNDYKIFSEYGETVINNPYCDNPDIIFPFLRNLFLKKENQIIKNKRIFITRRGKQEQHQGVMKRVILNEEEFFTMLKNYNFEYIQLENYSEQEKINLFNTSEIIISTHSSGLTYTLFANKDTKIIEILNRGEGGVANGHYNNICQHLKLNYHRYKNINEDRQGNIKINTKTFEKYLIKLFN